MRSYQPTLVAGGAPGVDADAAFERVGLDACSWIDVARGWLHGSDAVLVALATGVEWHRGRRWMYERMVDDPRLSSWCGRNEALPHPALGDMQAALEQRYGVRLGGAALLYYRDGRDSVAFHRDRELRHLDDTLIAIVSLGGARSFLVRPRAGGASRDLAPASGDLLVMGGSCQRDWVHAVPKVARAGPRISVSWRWSSGARAARITRSREETGILTD